MPSQGERYYRFDESIKTGHVLSSRVYPSLKRINSMRNRLSLEFRLECIRRRWLPSHPSRWTALFFFPTIEAARSVQRDHSGWRNTPLWEFRSFIEQGNRVHRHSYDLLTWLKGVGINATDDQLKAYWAGHSSHQAGFDKE